MFTVVPEHPVAGEGVVLTSTAFDPDGPIITQLWDLDGDGAFDDHTGEAALHELAQGRHVSRSRFA